MIRVEPSDSSFAYTPCWDVFDDDSLLTRIPQSLCPDRVTLTIFFENNKSERFYVNDTGEPDLPYLVFEVGHNDKPVGAFSTWGYADKYADMLNAAVAELHQAENPS